MERQRRLEDLLGRVRSGVRSMRGIQVDLGRDLLELQRLGDFRWAGATTFPIFCEQVGLSPVEGRELTAMAEAAEVRVSDTGCLRRRSSGPATMVARTTGV